MRLRTQAALAVVGVVTLAAAPHDTAAPVTVEAAQAPVLDAPPSTLPMPLPTPTIAAQALTAPPQTTTTATVPPTTTTEAPTTTTEPPTTTIPPEPEPPPTTSAPEPEPTTPTASPEPESAPKPEQEVVTRLPESAPSVAQPGGGWIDLRACESGGDYGAVQRGGPGRGAYQFDQPTWDGIVVEIGRADLVGMPPEQAAPSAQDQAALQLYSERGAQPWPYCGRYVA